MKKVFRWLWARLPQRWRAKFGRTWRVRGLVDKWWLGERAVDERLAQTGLFFLLGSGRCGTLFVSTLLNLDSEAIVLHEPRGHLDMAARPLSREDRGFGDAYIQRFRKYAIYRDVRQHGVSMYGEVSSPLRCLGAALLRSFPHARMMILARDGRDTVRSALNRQAGRGFKAMHDPVRPLPGDPFAERWASMTPYQKACWWWMDAYRTLLQDLPGAPVIHFEKTLRDYDYLKSHVLDPLGLDVSREQWAAHKARKSENAAEVYRVPHWREWSDEQKAFFDEVCGEMMERLGYPRGQWT